ncbi:uncharacterized [Tachysurus ichikawai]
MHVRPCRQPRRHNWEVRARLIPPAAERQIYRLPLRLGQLLKLRVQSWVGVLTVLYTHDFLHFLYLI